MIDFVLSASNPSVLLKEILAETENEVSLEAITLLYLAFLYVSFAAIICNAPAFVV